MKKAKTRQANYRLPNELLKDVAGLAPEIAESQTTFVIKALRSRIGQVKRRIERQRQTVETA